MLRFITQPLHLSLRPCTAGRNLLWIVTIWLVLWGGSPVNLSAQAERSAIFPAERHREIMEDLDFTPPGEEEEEEPEPVTEDADWDWDWGDLDFGLGTGGTITLIIVLLALLGFLIFRMLGDVNLRKRTRVGNEPDEISIDDIEEEKLVAGGVSLSLLERAERAGQFDVAVRLLYIQLLKELQDAGLIKYRKDFSSRDYQNQLRGRDVLPEVRAVTKEYQRYWFGKYPIDRLSYRNSYTRFTALHEHIRTTATTTGSGGPKTSPNA